MGGVGHAAHTAMSRVFTPSERASIASAHRGGATVKAIAKRYHVRSDTISSICKEVETLITTGKLTPPPYATGYRTAIYGVSNGAGGRRNLSWGTK